MNKNNNGVFSQQARKCRAVNRYLRCRLDEKERGCKRLWVYLVRKGRYHDHWSFLMSFLPPLMRPVLLAAIRPTFFPWGVSLLMVEGCPIC
jgi:hypothetical protein